VSLGGDKNTWLWREPLPILNFVRAGLFVPAQISTALQLALFPVDL
jgi:hypothetical protein